MIKENFHCRCISFWTNFTLCLQICWIFKNSPNQTDFCLTQSLPQIVYCIVYLTMSLSVESIIGVLILKLASALFIFFQKSVGTPGLTGLDRLLSFMIVTELQSLIRSYEKVILGDKVWQEQLKNLHSVLQPLNKLIRKYLNQFFLLLDMWFIIIFL